MENEKRRLFTCRDDESRGGWLVVDDDEKLVECLTDYTLYLCANSSLAIGTIEGYVTKARLIGEAILSHSRFKDLQGACLDDIVPHLNLSDFDLIFERLSKAGYKAATLRQIEAVSRSFTRFLASESGKHTLARPIFEGERARTPKPGRRIPKWIDIEALIDLTNELNFECQRVVVLFGFDTLVRASEIGLVRKIDIPSVQSFGDSEWAEIVIKGVKGSGGQLKERVANISRSTVARISAYHNSAEYRSAGGWAPDEKPAFLNTAGAVWNRHSIGKFVSRAARKVVSLSRDPVNPHLAFRHTGSRYVMSTPDCGQTADDRLHALKELLGHAHLDTTERYKNKKASDPPVTQDSIWRFEVSATLSRQTALPRRNQPAIPKGIRKHGHK
jgi:integrase